ncbi:MAG: tRNA 2-selenouridine(34) synthase MnmH, partial [Rhodobacterales bacterium]
RSIRGHAVVDGWLALLDSGEFRALAKALMEQHYDAAYAKSRGFEAPAVVATVNVSTLDGAGQDDASGQIIQALSAL